MSSAPSDIDTRRRDDPSGARNLAGRVALVTGGAAGIGRACVERFLADGCRVVVLERDVDGAAELAGIGTESVVFHHGDATAVDDAEAAATLALERWGRIDVLVNAAGGFTTAPHFEDLEPDEWSTIVELNLTSAYVCARAVLPTMRVAGFGRIVNVASMAGRTGLADISHAYTAAKAGVLGLTRSLALEVASDGITVNAVAPGVVWTPRVSKLHEQRVDQLLAATPVGRLAEAHDIADAIWYLARPPAWYVTGAVLDINGGRFMA